MDAGPKRCGRADAFLKDGAGVKDPLGPRNARPHGPRGPSTSKELKLDSDKRTDTLTRRVTVPSKRTAPRAGPSPLDHRLGPGLPAGCTPTTTTGAAPALDPTQSATP